MCGDGWELAPRDLGPDRMDVGVLAPTSSGMLSAVRTSSGGEGQRMEGTMRAEVLRKLDASLLALVQGGGLDETGQVPVFVRAVSGELDHVVEELARAGGRVRHVMKRLSAVSAWMPLGLVYELASKPFVDGLEMPQPVEIA